MPIRKYLGQRTFEPDVIVAMSQAFEAAVEELKADTVERKEVIAARIIAAAQRGETDPEKLGAAACRQGLQPLNMSFP